MRVPTQLLKQRCTVEEFAGSGAHSPLYGEPRPLRASIQPSSELHDDGHGQTIVIDALGTIRPEAGPIRPESRIWSSGVTYRVVRCYAVPDERRPYQWELFLVRFAQSTSPDSAGSGSGS